MSNYDFTPFKKAVQQQFAIMQTGNVFEVDFDKDEFWNIYLDSFPEGTNEIFRERREYDCRCCRQFLRNIGGTVSIVNNKVISLWDIDVPYPFTSVAKALSDYIKSKPIKDVFFHYESHVGTDKTRDAHSPSIQWQHFYVKLPKELVKSKYSIPSLLGNIRTTKEVFKRGLDELTLDAANMVIELIDQNSLYRGDQQKPLVVSFIKTKKAYDKLKEEEKDVYCWKVSQEIGEALARVRNTSIGQLLINLSEGMELEAAVKAYEKMVAPENYKRPTALITQSMIKQAQQTVADLGLEQALHRRFAVAEDVTVNNVLFADRSIKPKMAGAFDVLSEEVGKKAKVDKLDKVEEINIRDFIANVLPKINSMEMLFENKHVNNLVSLVAPVYELDSDHNLFKWNNNFSWSYNGEVADSFLREQVKARGGSVDGVIRFSFSWNHEKRNVSLMDAHVFMPGSTKSFDSLVNDMYGNDQRVGWNHRKHALSGGVQDVDYVDEAPNGYIPVENITFPSLSKLKDGKYTYAVHNWNFRNPTQGGFKAEIEFDGQIYQYDYDKPLKNKEWVVVAEVTLKNGVFTINHKLPVDGGNKNVWGIDTNSFHRVNMAMLSPNYWDENKVGTEHFFFMLEKCKADQPARGFYNEFLNQKLDKHRKVFEVLASRMKAEPTDNQLSGLGFSSTQRNSVVVKVSGSFQRMLKINF